VGAALDGKSIHLRWKGDSGEIWWSTFSQGEWSSQQEIFGGTSTAPVVVIDGNGVVRLTWLTPPSTSQILGALYFASLDSTRCGVRRPCELA
jgi:hypothetical protein